MLVTLRGQRVKGILVSMSLGIPLISFANMPSKHLFPNIYFQTFISIRCHFVVCQSDLQGKELGSGFFQHHFLLFL